MQVENPKHLYVFGAGGSGREIAWIASAVLGKDSRTQISFLVDDETHYRKEVHGIPLVLLGDVADAPESAFVAALGDPQHRVRAASNCRAAGLRPMTLVHPAAVVSPAVTYGAGTVIYPGTVISTDVVLGDHVQVNAGSTLAHDVRIADFGTISPGVHIAGHVHVGAGAFLGTGASVINGSTPSPLVIGNDAVIAAGACVVADVSEGSMVAGVPAVRRR